MKLLGMRYEYLRKYTPGDNGDIESFHNFLKTDYIWVTELEAFEDTRKPIQYVFKDYNTVRPHSPISFQSLDEFEWRLREEECFRNNFQEGKNRREERILKNRIERKRRLKEDVSLESRISVQN